MVLFLRRDLYPPRSPGGLHQTILLAGSFCGQTLGPAARHDVCPEVRRQRDGQRGRRRRLSNLHGGHFLDGSFAETAQSGNAGPGQRGAAFKDTVTQALCSRFNAFAELWRLPSPYLVQIDGGLISPRPPPKTLVSEPLLGLHCGCCCRVVQAEERAIILPL